MIDLEMASDPTLIELNDQLKLYNKILFALNIITIVGLTASIVSIINSDLDISFIRFVAIISSVLIILSIVDVFFAVIIWKGSMMSNSIIPKIYLIPVIVDILFVFILGFGIIRLFFRIVLYGALNPDTQYYDEEDPLFND